MGTFIWIIVIIILTAVAIFFCTAMIGAAMDDWTNSAKTLERIASKLSETAIVLVKTNNAQQNLNIRIEALVAQISSLKVDETAKMNKEAVKEMQKAVAPMQDFAKGMKTLSSFVSAANELSRNLAERDRRTESLSVIADFYKKEMHDIEYRRDAVRTAISQLDKQLQSALQILESNSAKAMDHLQQTYIHQMEKMEKMGDGVNVADKLSQIEEKIDAIANSRKYNPTTDDDKRSISISPSDVRRLEIENRELTAKVRQLSNIVEELQRYAPKRFKPGKNERPYNPKKIDHV